MPATDRFSSFPRATASALPSLSLLASCVLALVLLFAAPAALAAACSAGMGTPGCNADPDGSTVPEMAIARPDPWPGGRGVRPDSCAPGVHHEGTPGCTAAPPGAVVQGARTFMQMLTRSVQPAQ